MLTTISKLVMTTVFGLTMFAAGDAEAGKHHGDRGAKMCEKLECSAAQQTQLTQIRDSHKPTIKAERSAMRDLNQQIAAEYAKPSFDAAKVKTLREQLAAHETVAKSEREAMKAKIDAVLTPAQRAKMAEFKAKHKEGKGKGHFRGGRDGGRDGRGDRGERKGPRV
ncbi:Spy/CpxP family protein refolding chaperone [Nannocystis bainbridge]|uniref:Spy/CpxP family protein refolding chaperone n=1 Tax=Nannocystis bainbridge TaxID=2995303 RepID=A0ABT5DTK6_9BACT|nr:Spy/CpxP family protein refolding chaperone [Nannocystis bainbridge]MDC0715742.1 Spy/CpxP family protein refolding chaperone [Nannocystis bainbridge]